MCSIGFAFLSITYLFTSAAASSAIVVRNHCANDTEIIDYLMFDNAANYNKRLLPSTPVSVRIEMWVQEVTSVSELTQDFEIDMYMNEYWSDPGLLYEFLNPCQRNLSFDHTVMRSIWTPNTVFVNSKKALIHSSPFRNVFLMVFPNGSIWSNWRIKTTGPCEMDLSFFPMDRLECKLVFESYNYNRNAVRMRWNDNPVIIFKTIELPDFNMIYYNLSSAQKEYAAGLWDEMTITFTFQRRYGWYLLQGFIPTYMTVFISWIPFYLGPKAIPARTMIGVNALLAMSFQFGSIIRNLPRVSYIKAIDVWMLSGMCFIFLSLAELALVGYLTRDDGKPPLKKSTSRNWNLSKAPSLSDVAKKSNGLQTAENIDFSARLLFPALYTAYNLFYWMVYMRKSLENATL